MAKNTGVLRLNGQIVRPKGPWLWAKYHGGFQGEIPKSCRRLGWGCPHVNGGLTPNPAEATATNANSSYPDRIKPAKAAKDEVPDA